MQENDSRNFYEAIYKGAEQCAAALTREACRGYIIWAPDVVSALEIIIGSFAGLAVQPGFDRTLKLLVPFEPLPGCDTPALIEDLWRHPLIGGKWDTLVKSVNYLIQPTRYVFTGAAGPRYHAKHIAVITLSAVAASFPRAVVIWRPVIATENSYHAIVVDCAADESLAAQRALTGANLAGLLRWEGPARSRGSQGNRRRVSHTGYSCNRHQCTTSTYWFASSRDILP